MKAIKQFVLTLLGAVIIVIGAEFAVLKAVGKEGLQQVPVLSELFTVEAPPDVLEEPKDDRVDEIDAILAKLKEREALETEEDDELDQARKIHADIKAIEQRNLALFERIRQLYPVIDEARAESLTLLAKKYEKMTPDAAAKILEGKTDDQCAELLIVMNDRSSAQLLEAFAQMGESAIERERNRKRATKISQIMRNTLLLTEENAALFSPP
jgi:flagellar motility protein MotE (MotC chaperone)